MASYPALIIQSGVTRPITVADTLLVGSGISTPSGDLTLGATGSNITIQTGKTLGCAAGANINLPLQFKIDGTAVATTVTQTSLDAITAGSTSNGDSYHTHPNIASQSRNLIWCANDDLSAFDVGTGSPTNGTDGGDGFFDGTRRISATTTMSALRINQISPGVSGTTTVEFYRNRSGTFFLLGTINISTLSPYQTATVAPPSSPDDVLAVGDFVSVRFTSLQTSNGTTFPLNLSAQVETAS
jgi:hypothetical protein